jgi:hypothetical protein
MNAQLANLRASQPRVNADIATLAFEAAVVQACANIAGQANLQVILLDSARTVFPERLACRPQAVVMPVPLASSATWVLHAA